MIDFRLLVKSGVHFGHQSSRWCPRMAPYIWGKKSGVHLIDVSKTAHQLEKAAKFLEGVAKEGKTILWVGTKKPAQLAIKEAGSLSHMPSVVHRWIGGTLTNHIQVKKSITKLLHLEDVLKKSGDNSHYTKKELNSYQKRVDRLRKNIGGIITMKWPVGAIVAVDVRKEMSAIKEAVGTQIPVVALVDTNSDPSLVEYVIPANDDAPKSIKVLVDYLAESVKRGKEAFDTERQEKIEKEKVLLHETKKKAAEKKVAPQKVVTPQKAAPAKTVQTAPKKEAAKSAPKKAAPKKAAPKKEADKK